MFRFDRTILILVAEIAGNWTVAGDGVNTSTDAAADACTVGSIANNPGGGRCCSFHSSAASPQLLLRHSYCFDAATTLTPPLQQLWGHSSWHRPALLSLLPLPCGGIVGGTGGVAHGAGACTCSR